MSSGSGKRVKLRARLLDELAKAPDRLASEHPFALRERLAQVAFSNAGERAVIALALVILDQLNAAGGVDVDDDALSSALEHTLSTIEHDELVQLEIEAHHIFDWIGQASRGFEPAEPTPTPEFVNPDSPVRDVLRWAIHKGQDLELDYYDSQSGEFVSHKVTPMVLEAEHYLRALSHTTLDERLFEVHHIGQVAPTVGWHVHHEEHVNPLAPGWDKEPEAPRPARRANEPHHKHEPAPERQLSLLQEEE